MQMVNTIQRKQQLSHRIPHLKTVNQGKSLHLPLFLIQFQQIWQAKIQLQQRSIK